MRIALRTSGGRGEYELAGTQGACTVSDVIDHTISLQIYPGKTISTNNHVLRTQGKPRIRLVDQHRDQHIYQTLANILLLPRPIRELGKTPGGKLQLTKQKYSISSIKFDLVFRSNSSITIQPTDLVLENSDHDLARIRFVERFRLVLDVWGQATHGVDQISAKIIAHKNAVASGDIRSIQECADEIRDETDIDDPLEDVLRQYQVIDPSTYGMGVHRDGIESAILDEDNTLLIEAAKDRIKEWRQQAARGSKGERFRKDVKSAYRHKCLFSGYYLPKSDLCRVAGVDSAHILPWSDFGINTINNGLCLNKLCHWAFDSGVLLLSYDNSDNQYRLTLSTAALAAEKTGDIDLEGFKPFLGVIPENRFPNDPSLWPCPTFLAEYNRLIESIQNQGNA